MFYYPIVNQAFLAHTQTDYIYRSDYPEWHKGRKRYYVWAIMVEHASILNRVISQQQHLQRFLVPNYSRQAHITLAVCGFLSTKKQYNDDILESDLAAQIDRLNQLNLKEFTLDIAGVNSFSTVPFLEVLDANLQLSLIRENILIEKNDFRSQDFLPHITLGFYQAAHNTQQLNSFFEEAPLLSMPVKTLGLYSYDAHVFGSALQLEQELMLGALT